MRFERFMALRYLRGAEGRAGEGRGFLRFVTYVSVGGVAVGVAALLLALAIVRGFSSEIQEKITGFGAHVQVRSYTSDPLGRVGHLEERLAAQPHVESVAPVVQGFALLRHRAGEIDGVSVWGAAAPPPYLRRQVVAGQFSFAPDSAGRPGVVVGATLARRLGLAVGDVATLFSTPEEPEAGGNASGSNASGSNASGSNASGSNASGSNALGGGGAMPAPRVKQFHVSGLFETSLLNFDDLYVFTGLEPARDLAGLGPAQATRLDLTLDRVERADSVAAGIEEQFDFPVHAVTIYEAYSGLFAWVNLQESITPLVIGVIILVAAFNIIGTLLMLMVEKTREMGVLASLGASRARIQRLFLGLGLLIGAVGTALGALGALALAVLQQRYELIPLPAEAYFMTSAPVELRLLDFVLVAGVAMLLCAAASYLPARAAARIDPVRAIRFR